MVAESGSGKKLILGDGEIAIGKTDAQAFHVDFLTEHRVYNGTVALSFGCMHVDGNGEGVLDVVSRLRMNLVTAQVMRNILTSLIDEALKPADTSKAN